MKPVISFCITVYNQSSLLKECIDSIVAYKGEDIEIIISDDKSSENIKSVIEPYHDDRIIYRVNEVNEGHDRNILEALDAANGKYAFLLRTRDRMIPKEIPHLVKFAKENDASYITGAAVNQLGQPKLAYSRLEYKKGRDAIAANYKLYVHPSGCMYRLSDISIHSLRTFLDSQNMSKIGFVVHNLIRIDLAGKGDFKLIREPVWVYTDTEAASDKAVNHAAGRVSVYDPSYTIMRYEIEVEWSRRVLKAEDYYYNFLLLTEFYLDQLTWNFMLTNADKKNQEHYQYDKRQFSLRTERQEFRKVCGQYYDLRMNVPEDTFNGDINRIFKKNIVNGGFKYLVRKITNGTRFYGLLAALYKKVFRGL